MDLRCQVKMPSTSGRRLGTWVLVSATLGLGLGWQGSQAADTPPYKPVPFTLEQVQAGHAQFDRTCAQCHGRNMVNAGTTVFDLRKFPVDDRDRFFNSVTNGKGNMPSFKDGLTNEQISSLWSYVATRGGKEL